MKILDRYVSAQVLGTVTWAISLLTMILVLGNVLRDLLSLLISHQVPVTYILTFIAYLLPFSMTYSIPWGVLVAVLLVFGRLSSDNELVALRANGVGMLRICHACICHRLRFSWHLSMDQPLRCPYRGGQTAVCRLRSGFQ